MVVNSSRSVLYAFDGKEGDWREAVGEAASSARHIKIGLICISSLPCRRHHCGPAGAQPSVGRSAAPQGKRPTLMVLIGSRFSTSITVTSPETPLVVKSRL